MDRKPKRDALDHMAVTAPSLARPLSAGVRRLKPGSPLRRRAIQQLAKRAFAAMARSDVEVVVQSYEPDAEVWMRAMAGVGVSDCYLGHEGIRALYAELDDVFSDWSWSIREIADAGDGLAIRADFVGHGRGSGVETKVKDGATAVRFSDRGLVAWQEWFTEEDAWAKARGAVGLRR